MVARTPISSEYATGLFEAYRVRDLLKTGRCIDASLSEAAARNQWEEGKSKVLPRLREIAAGHPNPDQPLYEILGVNLSLNQIFDEIERGTQIGDYAFANITVTAACHMWNPKRGEGFFEFAMGKNDSRSNLRTFYNGSYNPFEQIGFQKQTSTKP